MNPLRAFLSARPPRANPSGYLSEDWCRELGRRFLRPERPRLAEARALTRGLTREVADAAAAWERLLMAGLLPEDAARRFVDEPMMQGAGRVAPWPSPRTVEAAVTVAGDPPGVLRAEEAMAEWNARKVVVFSFDALADAGLGGERADGTLWRVLPEHSALHRSTVFLDDLRAAAGWVISMDPANNARWEARGRPQRLAFIEGLRAHFPVVSAGLSLREGRDIPSLQMAPPYQVARAASGLLTVAAAWRAAAAAGVTATFEDFEEPLVVPLAVPLAELPDPFAPLLDVLWGGYLPGRNYAGRALIEAPAADPARMSARFLGGAR